MALTWNAQGHLARVLGVLDDPVEFLVGGGDLLTKIEEALQGICPGREAGSAPGTEEAFGDYNDQLVFLERAACFRPSWKKA